MSNKSMRIGKKKQEVKIMNKKKIVFLFAFGIFALLAA